MVMAIVTLELLLMLLLLTTMTKDGDGAADNTVALDYDDAAAFDYDDKIWSVAVYCYRCQVRTKAHRGPCLWRCRPWPPGIQHRLDQERRRAPWSPA